MVHLLWSELHIPYILSHLESAWVFFLLGFFLLLFLGVHDRSIESFVCIYCFSRCQLQSLIREDTRRRIHKKEELFLLLLFSTGPSMNPKSKMTPFSPFLKISLTRVILSHTSLCFPSFSNPVLNKIYGKFSSKLSSTPIPLKSCITLHMSDIIRPC